MLAWRPDVRGRDRNRGRNFSFDTLLATRECVLHIPTVDLARRRLRTIHHLGRGAFMVAGRTIRLPLRMR